jgi:hypothetical protein
MSVLHRSGNALGQSAALAGLHTKMGRRRTAYEE